MYMWYKFRPVTTVWTNLACEYVKDVTGVYMYCSWTWNDPGKRRQFAGALYCIHVASKQNGLYCEMCDKCRALILPTSAAMLNTASMPFACSVVELAQQFIITHLQVAPTHVIATSPTFLCDKSVKFVRPIQATERIKNLLSTMPPAVSAELTMLVAIQLQEGVETIMASQHTGPNIAQVFPTYASVGITATSNPATTSKKGCIHRSIHFHEIADLKAAKDPRKKLEGILKMAVKMASLETRDVTESTRQFVIKYVKKVHHCFLRHCDADADKFLSLYPNFKHTTFKCTCEE